MVAVVMRVKVHNLTEEECRAALQEILDKYKVTLDEVRPGPDECGFCCMTPRARELGVTWDDWYELENWLWLLGEG